MIIYGRGQGGQYVNECHHYYRRANISLCVTFVKRNSVRFDVLSKLLQFGVEVEAEYLWLLGGRILTSVVGVRGQRLALF